MRYEIFHLRYIGQPSVDVLECILLYKSSLSLKCTSNSTSKYWFSVYFLLIFLSFRHFTVKNVLLKSYFSKRWAYYQISWLEGDQKSQKFFQGYVTLIFLRTWTMSFSTPSYTFYDCNKINGPKLRNKSHFVFWMKYSAETYVFIIVKVYKWNKILMMSYIFAHHNTKIWYFETNYPYFNPYFTLYDYHHFRFVIPSYKWADFMF